VDLSTVHGTGPGGAIERADFENAAKEKAAPAPAPPAEPAVADFHIRMRRAIAAAMARSNRDVPHYYLETPIDMSRALRWLESENQKRPIKERLLPVVLLLKAVQRAVTEVPDLNGYWTDDRLDRREAVHIGFAISVRQGGLITPAIHDVQKKSLSELMSAIHDLIPRARAGRLRSSELSDATITVTSLGDLGVQSVYGVIYPPQVAIVGFGKITEQPWAENGMLGIRPILTATLAADHRATDGHMGAQFLEALNRCLQEPEKL
jgi:pyruvate dehydrogenase E2 component (dihydrolipoamide acetyltransferase)